MVEEIVGQFLNPFNFVFVFNVESFVAYTDLIFHQKRRLASDLSVKGIKQFILNTVIVRIIDCVAAWQKLGGPRVPERLGNLRMVYEL